MKQTKKEIKRQEELNGFGLTQLRRLANGLLKNANTASKEELIWVIMHEEKQERERKAISKRTGEIESALTTYYSEKYGKVAKNLNKYSAMDIVLELSNRNLAMEIKVRYGKYTCDYLLKNGAYVEYDKLTRANKEFGVNKYVLIIVTADNKVLTSVVDGTEQTENKRACKTTHTRDNEWIEKKMTVVKEFKVADIDINEVIAYDKNKKKSIADKKKDSKRVANTSTYVGHEIIL